MESQNIKIKQTFIKLNNKNMVTIIIDVLKRLSSCHKRNKKLLY